MLGTRKALSHLNQDVWDLLVVGGGITGAGVALQGAAHGSTLLLEQRDFAWGTSSRSSKMVHGGLRYIAQGDIRLTRESLQERERLLRELPELVKRCTYVFPVRKGSFPGRWPMTLLLWLYDRLAGIRDHRWINAHAVSQRVPGISTHKLRGAMTYTDALTDDCRLVLRTLHEAVDRGATLRNYTRVQEIRRAGGVCHVRVEDSLSGEGLEIQARHVINATGAWADRLSGADARIRPLRGSHLFVSAERLPVRDCVTLLHPDDQRPVFVFPWEGLTCIGTTDLDHQQGLDQEPSVSEQEVAYLLALVNSQFPAVALGPEDIVSTMAGVRPVIASGKGLDPSRERRDHAVWDSDGVVTVSGGKLTTFRVIALDALRAAGMLDAAAYAAARHSKAPLYGMSLDAPQGLGDPLAAPPEDAHLGVQLAWVMQNEMVVHLDDLLLRRTRIGNLSAQGGRALLSRWRALIQETLEWDDARWSQEYSRYQKILHDAYSLPLA